MTKSKTAYRIILSLALVLCVLQSYVTALAFESTSASFEIHAGDIESTVGTSTSATFGLHNAGGQTATASSTSATKQVLSGVLYWLYSFFVSSYDQIHYRWRADDGGESSGGSALYFNPTGNGFAVSSTINGGCTAGSEWDCIDDDTNDTQSTTPTTDGDTSSLQLAGAIDYYTLANDAIPAGATITQLDISAWVADTGNPNTSVTLGYCTTCDGTSDIMGVAQTVSNATYYEIAQQFSGLNLTTTDLNNMQMVASASGNRAKITALYMLVTYTSSGATWPVNEDTQYVSFPKNTFKRLRLEVANNGGWTRGTAPSFTLEVAQTATCSNGTYVAVPTTYGAGAWVIATSTNITDGAATTNTGTPPTTGLTDVGSTFVAGQTKTTGNTTSAITLAAGSFTEIEYALSATSNAVGGSTYCFRVTNNGGTTGFVYSQYAKAVIESGLPATGTLDSAVFDTYTTTGALQGPAYNSIMWKGSQNGSLGKVQFQLATSDCANGATDYSACSTGSWSFVGGATCNSAGYYDTTGPEAPVELSCAPAGHNNQRYFRYRVRLCSADCSASGTASPIVNDVVVNWAP